MSALSLHVESTDSMIDLEHIRQREMISAMYPCRYNQERFAQACYSALCSQV